MINSFIAKISLVIGALIGLLFPAPPAEIILPTQIPTENISAMASSSTKEASKSEIKTEKTDTATTTAKKTESQENTPKTSENKDNFVVSVPPNPSNQKTTDNIDWESLNKKSREAIVNILCTSASGGLINPISGSGVIIDPRGVILTNAHVAQYILIKDYSQPNFLECIVRQGNPARPFYKTKLIYISPQWVSEHKNDILLQDPLSTGERDFALLLIGDPVGPSVKKPDSFPYLEIDTTMGTAGLEDPVLITAYPAGFLGGVNIQTSLYQSSAYSTIKEVLTFATSTIDAISLGGTVVAQKGSSGGGVVNSAGKIVGIVVTSSEGTSTDSRDLRALTPFYINEVVTKETGLNIKQLLAGNLNILSDSFEKEISPILSKLFFETLNKSLQ